MRLRFKKYVGKIATLLTVCMALSSPVMAAAKAVDTAAPHCQHLQQAVGQDCCQPDCCSEVAACVSLCTANPATGLVAIPTPGLVVTFYQTQSVLPQPNQFLQGVVGVVELHPPR